jgi:hypothetical protein
MVGTFVVVVVIVDEVEVVWVFIWLQPTINTEIIRETTNIIDGMCRIFIVIRSPPSLRTDMVPWLDGIP